MNKVTNTFYDCILIDGSSYLYRAFHALPPLKNSKGEPTGALYGVVNMIRKLNQEYQPNYIAVVFDTKGKTFRHERYEQYKAHRPQMPEELIQQIAPLHEFICALGLPLLLLEGYEADDIIGTLTHEAVRSGLNVLISTGDKDMAQLVNPHVHLINTMTHSILDEAGVCAKFGVPPSLIIDYLALIGDTSDNVPGVPQVGPKTAVKWLTEYKSLAGIVAHAHEIKGKVGDSLRASLNDLPLSQELVTIHTEVPLPIHIENLVPAPIEKEGLLSLCERYEFKSLLQEFKKSSVTLIKASQYQAIFDEEKFQNLLTHLQKTGWFCFDTETTSLNTLDAELVGLSFATTPHDAVYIPLAHHYENVPKQLSRERVLDALKPLFENPNVKKIGHNLKYDMNVLLNYDIHVNGITHDTLLESYVLNSVSNRHDLDTLAEKHFQHKTITYKELAGVGQKQKRFDEISIEAATEYAAEDADITLKLHELLWPQIVEKSGLKTTFEEIEMPLIKVLAKMERYGVLIDAEKLKIQSEALSERLKTLEQEAFKLAECVFNLNSPKQLQEIFFEKQKLPVIEKTPSGQPSTSEATLEILAVNYPLPRTILEYRGLNKLKSTYTDRLPEQIHPKTGRVHTSYNQAVTATGRLSSTDPNLQNIPARTEEGLRIREAFIAPKNYILVSADYSQIELRIMAHLSQDPGLCTAFTQGADIHRATAAEIFGVSQEAVTSEQRRHAKAINFGLIYGMSSFGLARQLGIPRGLAQEFIDIYFQRYPNVKFYMENTRALAHKQEYVETLFGRRLYLPEINSRNVARQRAAERAAINAPMQGTAADIIKHAMIKIDECITQKNVDARMVMQVHDELIFEVHMDVRDEFIKILDACMTQAASLDVPLEVNIGYGVNWRQAHGG